MKKVFISLFFILIFLLVLSCGSLEWFFGEGRGDWTLDIANGYCISKINSREVLLIHKDSPGDSGGSIVLPNYFVTSYQQYEQYIFLEGISTQGRTASEEELETGPSVYYVLDSGCAEIEGPFQAYDKLLKYCNEHEIEIEDEWLTAEKNM